MASQPPVNAFIIAARRTALGRIGGLHRSRRIEDLAAPVVRAVCEDGGVGLDEIEDIIVGNATAGANPAADLLRWPPVCLKRSMPQRSTSRTRRDWWPSSRRSGPWRKAIATRSLPAAPKACQRHRGGLHARATSTRCRISSVRNRSAKMTFVVPYRSKAPSNWRGR